MSLMQTRIKKITETMPLKNVRERCVTKRHNTLKAKKRKIYSKKQKACEFSLESFMRSCCMRKC